MNRDLEHLKILSILHYIFGGLVGLGACFFFIYLLMGIAVLTTVKEERAGVPDAALTGWVFVIMGIVFPLVAGTFATCLILAGRYLAAQRRHTFCIVTAAICCLQFPFGTLLGIFTIIVLMRESVKQLFAERDRAGFSAS